MEKLVLKFTIEKETRNTIRYKEELGEESGSRDIAVGTIYIQKEALGESAPGNLKVTIEEDEL